MLVSLSFSRGRKDGISSVFSLFLRPPAPASLFSSLLPSLPFPAVHLPRRYHPVQPVPKLLRVAGAVDFAVLRGLSGDHVRGLRSPVSACSCSRCVHFASP